MKVYLLRCLRDGFVYGIYSTYDLMIKKIKETPCMSKSDFHYFELDTNECDKVDFDYYCAKEFE